MTTREDRLPNPAVDRDRAIAALIYCAKKHPDKTLGEVIEWALPEQFSHCQYAVLVHETDEALTAAFHKYAREQA